MGSTGMLLALLQTLLCVSLVQGHGRLIEPPSRSSMWRFGYKTPINYNDNQLNCGGFGVQYGKQVGGKCGVCGDPWVGPHDHELGGKYATGMIVRSYDAGAAINITIDLTANHKGYFEFRLCEKDSRKKRVTLECLNKHLLKIEGTGKTRHQVVKKELYTTIVNLQVRLPAGVTCSACVLQWKYNAGNSWGYDENGKGCLGCGNQEQFYGCADVAIGHCDIKLGRAAYDTCIFANVKDNEWVWVCEDLPKIGQGRSGVPIGVVPSLMLNGFAVMLFFTTLA